MLVELMVVVWLRRYYWVWWFWIIVVVSWLVWKLLRYKFWLWFVLFVWKGGLFMMIFNWWMLVLSLMFGLVSFMLIMWGFMWKRESFCLLFMVWCCLLFSRSICSWSVVVVFYKFWLLLFENGLYCGIWLMWKLLFWKNEESFLIMLLCMCLLVVLWWLRMWWKGLFIRLGWCFCVLLIFFRFGWRLIFMRVNCFWWWRVCLLLWCFFICLVNSLRVKWIIFIFIWMMLVVWGECVLVLLILKVVLSLICMLKWSLRLILGSEWLCWKRW